MAKNEEPVDQSTLAWRIWKARTDAGMTQGQLAKRAGLKSQSIIGMLESGQRRRTTYIVQIADALMVDPAWLTEGRGPKRPEGGPAGVVVPIPDLAMPVRTHYVPVVGTTQGGPTTRVWTDGDIPVGDGFGWVSVSSRDKNAFALRVEGSSMAPRYEHGEYVLVEPNRRPEPGDDVIVRLRGGECMIKRLSARRPHELALDSLSQGYDRITVAPEQVEFLYYVAAGLRAGSFVMHVHADQYDGADRRWHDMPAETDRRKGGEN